MLASGLDGIEKGLDAGKPNSDNLYSFSYDELGAAACETLPGEPARGGRRARARRRAARRARPGRDEDYVDYYAKVKRDEWFRYHEQVTEWELREYLTRF